MYIARGFVFISAAIAAASVYGGWIPVKTMTPISLGLLFGGGGFFALLTCIYYRKWQDQKKLVKQIDPEHVPLSATGRWKDKFGMLEDIPKELPEDRDGWRTVYIVDSETDEIVDVKHLSERAMARLEKRMSREK